jgi:cold shock CspA family protein/ribosome-associated translation inhibitor RaiA
MQIPLEISYLDINKTEELDQLIHEKATALEKVCDYITSCRATLENPLKAQNSGQPFRIRISVRVPPGHEIVAVEEPGPGDSHIQLASGIRNAFENIRRQLKKLTEKQRKDIKSHPDQQVVAVIDKVFREEGYGFLRTVEGQQIYFHKNSVLHDDWNRLKEGTGVHFNQEIGDKGLQATAVQIVDKRK